MLEEALALARRGYLVLPVARGDKRPLSDRGVSDATDDAATIEKWYQQWPDMNIGVAGSDQLVMIDIDGAIGEQSLFDLCPPAKMPITPTVRTPNDGKHHYFNAAGQTFRNTVGVRPGIDVRSARSYCVAPPSSLGEGREYLWEIDPDEAELAPIPEWLATVLVGSKCDAIAISSPGKLAPGAVIPEGERDSRLTQIAGGLRRNGASVQAIIDHLTEVNITRCHPPLDEEQVMKIAGSVGAYPVGPFNMSDVGNAERFTYEHGERLRYVAKWHRWISWTGVRWELDDVDSVTQHGIQVVRNIYSEAARCADAMHRSALGKWASQSENAFRISSMIRLAQSFLPVMPEELDRDKWLLGVRNGVVDLQAGELGELRRSDYITKCADVTYNPEAEPKLWLTFVGRIFDWNDKVIEFIQRAVGYSATGSNAEQVVFILHGTGSNGKSTFLEVIREILGDHAKSIRPDSLMANKQQGVSNDIAALQGVRFATAVETESGNRLHESLIKSLSGGDHVSARFLYSEFFDFEPVLKAWIACNHKPRIIGQDQGIWRRIMFVPFDVSITAEERDKDLKEKLLEEREGILNWIIEGARMWQERGLDPPEKVRKATSDYKSEMDVLRDFIDGYLVERPGARTQSSVLYKAYGVFCENEGAKRNTQKWLSLAMEERGYRKERTRNGVMWLDIEVSTDVKT